MKRFTSAVIGMVALVFVPVVHAEDEHYPTIHHAITALEQTKEELQSGEHGFGGHRSQAIEHIDAALSELHQALEYADTHPDAIKPPEKQ